MCGIVGIVSNKSVSSSIISALKKLSIVVMTPLVFQLLKKVKLMNENVLEELII